MKKYTFLISTERSGSNFITSLLNGHPDISGPPPSHLFRLFGINRYNYGNLEKDENWSLLLSDFIANYSVKLGTWNTSISEKELETKSLIRSVSELLKIIYEKEAEYDNKIHIFVKENYTYSFLIFLLSSFPESKYIWLVRDPRDVVSSWVNTKSIPGGTEKAVNNWLMDQSETLKIYYHLHDMDKILMVRYEDLISNTERSLIKILDFMQLEYHKTILQFNKDKRTIKNAHKIDAWGNLAKPVIENNMNKYHSILNNEDIYYIELYCFELMKHLGYSTVNNILNMSKNNIQSEIERILPMISNGEYDIDNMEEQKLRDKRQDAINLVLSRRLY